MCTTGDFCPGCNTRMTTVQNVLLSEMLDFLGRYLLVTCPNYAGGCCLYDSVTFIADHLRNACPGSMVNCFACKSRIYLTQLHYHLANCTQVVTLSRCNWVTSDGKTKVSFPLYSLFQTTSLFRACFKLLDGAGHFLIGLECRYVPQDHERFFCTFTLYQGFDRMKLRNGKLVVTLYLSQDDSERQMV